MAQRRMFSLKIIDTDSFLDMPVSARELYFQLSMRADDDGFIGNARKIVKMIGATDDDLKVLFGKKFIIPFESGVCVVKDWKIHNYIQSDRYQETQYVEEKSLLKEENGRYLLENNECIQNVSKMDTQVRLGKVRLGKDNHNLATEVAENEVNKIISSFKDVNPSYERLFSNKTERAAVSRLIKKFGAEKLKTNIEHLKFIINRPFAPKVTTPYMFEKKLGELIAFTEQEKEKNKPNVAIID